jgi:16S rRNA G1207 methylase RsmC
VGGVMTTRLGKARPAGQVTMSEVEQMAVWLG